jgi:MFS family permease
VRSAASTVRGIPLAAAGLASGANACFALLASLLGGRLADQVGAKAVVIGGLALASVGFLLYLEVHEAWQAILVGALLGTAAGGWLTGQSALLAAIVPSEKRHIAFAQQRVAANLGLGLGGLFGGLIASTASLETFTWLFVFNSASFAVYGLFVARIAVPARTIVQLREGYARVLRDRTLLFVLAIDVALVAGAVSLLNGLMPVYARDSVGVRESAIGALFLVNSLLIIGGQLPIARAVEDHRRARALALTGASFAACWLLVLGGSWWFLLAAMVALSAGECLYDSVRSPLVADLAPAGLGGRYLAAAGFSWQLGFIVGPAVGAVLLGLSPRALWLAASALCLGAAAAALRLDHRLTDDVAVTPSRAAA